MPSRALGAIALSSLVLAGCFTSTADFQNDAEDFIRDDEQLAEALGTMFVTVECEEPPNRDPNTTFLCTAEDDDERTWVFQIIILDSNEYEVNVFDDPRAG